MIGSLSPPLPGEIRRTNDPELAARPRKDPPRARGLWLSRARGIDNQRDYARPPLVVDPRAGAWTVAVPPTASSQHPRAGGNSSSEVRRGAIVSYCLGWLKPYENQWLAYPPSIARNFDPELAALVGYAQHRPNLGNFEGQCPSLLLNDEIPDRIGAVDALRPDQAEQVAEFVRAQERRLTRTAA